MWRVDFVADQNGIFLIWQHCSSRYTESNGLFVELIKLKIFP